MEPTSAPKPEQTNKKDTIKILLPHINRADPNAAKAEPNLTQTVRIPLPKLIDPAPPTPVGLPSASLQKPVLPPPPIKVNPSLHKPLPNQVQSQTQTQPQIQTATNSGSSFASSFDTPQTLRWSGALLTFSALFAGALCAVEAPVAMRAIQQGGPILDQLFSVGHPVIVAGIAATLGYLGVRCFGEAAKVTGKISEPAPTASGD